MRWLALGPPRRTMVREIVSATALAPAPALGLIALAAWVELILPGTLTGTAAGALTVPAPVAIALSACTVGFGLALWFRLTRPGSPGR